MMISEPHQYNPKVYVSPWAGHHTNHPFHISCPFSDNVISNISPAAPSSNNHSHTHLNYDAILTALQRYLPSNTAPSSVGISDESDLDLRPEVYTSDEFRMYDFKVRKCARAGSHDWTDCPYAHPGEKARRRDPRKYNYSGTACTDFRKGGCRKGDGCEFAHGVFECWLHPTRYRTQACKDGSNCKRRVCFFAHAPEELRMMGSGGGNSSPDPYEDMFGTGSGSITASPSSMTPVMESPPLTPMAASSLSRSIGSSSISDLVASLRHLQLNKVKSMPATWRNANVQLGSPRFAAAGGGGTGIRPGFFSLPCTPTRPGYGGYSDSVLWEAEMMGEEGWMERVESGRELRARLFEKLGKENPLRRVVDAGEGTKKKGLPPSVNNGPDVGWVSDLVQ